LLISNKSFISSKGWECAKKEKKMASGKASELFLKEEVPFFHVKKNVKISPLT